MCRKPSIVCEFCRSSHQAKMTTNTAACSITMSTLPRHACVPIASKDRSLHLTYYYLHGQSRCLFTEPESTINLELVHYCWQKITLLVISYECYTAERHLTRNVKMTPIRAEKLASSVPASFLVERCNFIAKIGYWHKMSVCRLSVMRVYCDRTMKLVWRGFHRFSFAHRFCFSF